MSVLDKLKSALGFESEPRWKRRPEFYYLCPECEEIAVVQELHPHVEWIGERYEAENSGDMGYLARLLGL